MVGGPRAGSIVGATAGWPVVSTFVAPIQSACLELPQFAREVGFELRNLAGESGIVTDPVLPGLQRFRYLATGGVRA